MLLPAARLHYLLMTICHYQAVAYGNHPATSRAA
jgi:hypothetical protein